ncbi:MAG: ABC transporter permease [Actinomycetota bacterium]
MWRATLKSLLARKLRLVLTALAVVLGVGFVVGTLVLTDTLSRAFDQAFATTTEGTDVVVRGESAFDPGFADPGSGAFEEQPAVPEDLLDDVAAVDGVADAAGEVTGYAQLIDPGTGDPIETMGAPTIGVSWNPSSGGLEVRTGSPPGPGEVAVDADTAERFDLRIGQRIEVILVGPTQEFTISGTVGIGDLDGFGGGTLTVFDVGTAQEVFDRVGEFDAITVAGEEGVPAAALRARVQEVLPRGYEAVLGSAVAAEAADEIEEGLGFFRTGLLVFAGVSLFVGAFIIFNTFNIIVTQRIRELGLLRALGASRRQVQTSVLAEAVVIGLIASVAGIGVGILLSFGLRALLDAFGAGLPSTPAVILPRTLIVGVLIGTVVTVVAGVAPARRASRISPIEALREGQLGPTASLRRRVIVGGVVTVVGAAALLYGLFGGPSDAALIVGLGAALTFVGVATLSPLVARPLAWILGAPLRALGFAGRLGRENAMRNPRRTASTAAALMIGLGLVTFVAVFADSLKASSEAALDEAIRSDFILTSGGFAPLSPQVAEDLEGRPEIAVVSPTRLGAVRIEGGTDFVTAVDPATFGQVTNTEFAVGSLGSLGEPDTIVVLDDVAESNGWALGDRIEVRFAQTGTSELTVGGLYEDPQILGNYAMSFATFEENFAQRLDTYVLVKLAEGVSPAEGRRVLEAATESFPNVQVQDQAGFKQQQEDLIDQLLAMVQVLLLLAIVIALFGIVNTLGLSVYERVRELGLLRAVGMSRGQVRRMIRSEAVIIAVLGGVLGAAIGVLFGWAMQGALASLGIDRLRVPIGAIVVYLVVAGLAGVIAAIWPARRAARLNVLEAIAYE